MRIFLKENSYNNYVVFDKQTVNSIRKKSPTLNYLLRNRTFEYSKDFWFKGGVARYALMVFFDKNVYDVDIRDLDAVYFSKNSITYEEKDKIKELNEFEDIDIEFVYGTKERFLLKTDIAQNSVLLRPDKMICSRRAIAAIQSDKIKSNTFYGKTLSERQSARTLLFASRYGLKIPEHISFTIENGFEFLVVLIKAYELGIHNRFFNLCKKYNLTFKTLNIIAYFKALLDNNSSFVVGQDRANSIANKMIYDKVDIKEIKALFNSNFKTYYNDLDFKDIPVNLIKKYNRNRYGR